MKFEKKNFEHYGEDEQLDKLKEELSELYEAADYYQFSNANGTGPICFNHLCEEIADVQFLLNQFMTQKSYRQRVKWWYKFKVNRQKERIASDK